MPYYAELILPLALDTTYYYRLPEAVYLGVQTLEPGMRVVVSFGARRFYTAMVYRLVCELPVELSARKLKHIESVIDRVPLVDAQDFALWEWLADYYQCSLGQVMRAALPGGLLPESQTIVRLAPDFECSLDLPEADLALLDLLGQTRGQSLSLGQIHSRLGADCTRIFDRLYQMGALHIEEALQQRYKPKLQVCVGLGDGYRSLEGLARAEQLLHRAPRQAELLGVWLEQAQELGVGLEGVIARTDLVAGFPARLTLVRNLVARGIFRLESLPKSRLEPISALGKSVLEELPSPAPIESPVGLLYTTRSRDRELQIIAQIAEAIARGEQVLLLTPSAASVPHQADFLAQLAEAAQGQIYYEHPLVGETKRAELYLKLSTSIAPCLVVGTRQAVLLPMRRLGMIIVDQEQEYLYKQQHVAPLYHARDVALWRGHQRQIPVLLASETPSAEALFNVLRGKYSLLALSTPTTSSVPSIQIEVIDLAQQRAEGRMPYGTSLSQPLKAAIDHTLHQGKRVLLLQNRRGYAPYAVCAACGARLGCPHCDVSLTYHSSQRRMICHYCRYEQPFPVACPSCGVRSVPYGRSERPALTLVGHGVERVEQEIEELWPDAVTLRIDSESLQSRKRLAELHERILAGDTDIIIGTQLIKGQPIWSNIGLIAVVQLDAILAFPDFRAQERAYQLLMQFMLRTSQANEQQTCRLLLQTFKPEHPFIGALARRDYRRFIGAELSERHLLHFPPFYRMTCIRLKARQEDLVQEIALFLASLLSAEIGSDRMSEVYTPYVGRIDNQYIREFFCRRLYSETYHQERSLWRKALEDLYEQHPQARRVSIVFDVDPL